MLNAETAAHYFSTIPWLISLKGCSILNVMNETDSVTHVLLYGKDFFRDEVNLLIWYIAIDFVVFLKRIHKPFYHF